MEILGLLFAILFISLIVIGIVEGKKLQAAKTAYEKSLQELRNNPTLPNLRVKTLEVGRAYSNLTRGKRGVAMFDEIALKNDIDAACAGAVNVVQDQMHSNPSGTISRDEVECHYCAELILKKAKICKHCKQPLPNHPAEKPNQPETTSKTPPEKIGYICQCGQLFHMRPELAGRRARCPKCQAEFQIPSS